MARIMSLVFMAFMLVPVLAPTIGQGILLLFPWRAIFIVLALYAAGDAGLGVGAAARDAAPRISAARSNWRAMGGAMLDDAAASASRSATRWR